MHIARVFQDESNMEIRRISWRRGIEQVADCKLESSFIFEESNLLLVLIAAMEAEEGLEEVASCINIGYLKIDVFESQGLPRSGARLEMQRLTDGVEPFLLR